jgi:hypothetical protein
MNWETIIIAIIGSGLITALINGLMNYQTRIRIIKKEGLYKKRVDVLDSFIEKIEDLNFKIKNLVSPFQLDGSEKGETKRQDEVRKSFNGFSFYFQKNRQYLSKELAEEISKMRRNYLSIFHEFIYEIKPLNNLERWSDLNKKAIKDFENKSDKIVDEVRKIIGVK